MELLRDKYHYIRLNELADPVEILLKILQNDFDENFTIENVELIIAKLSDSGFEITESSLYDSDSNNF